MPESADEIYARALAAADPDGRLADATGRGVGHVPVRRRPARATARCRRSRRSRPAGAQAASTAGAARPGVDDAIWYDERWLVGPLPKPSGLPVIVILYPRAHHDLGDLPPELAAELGPLIQRVEHAVRSVGEIGRVHVCRWGDGSEHLHWWFMARPARLPQLVGSFAAIWDDILPPTPEDVWRENLRAVARRSRGRRRNRARADGGAGLLAGAREGSEALAARGGRRGHRGRHVRVRAAADRVLPRRVGGREGALLAVDRRAGRGDRAEHRDVRAAVDGRLARPGLPPGARHDAGLDRALDRRPGWGGGRHRRLVRDAAQLGVRSTAGGDGGDADRGLEPAREPRLPGGRARPAHAQRRSSPAAHHGGDRRLRSVRGRRHRPLARAVDRRPRARRRRRGGACREPRPRG